MLAVLFGLVDRCSTESPDRYENPGNYVFFRPAELNDGSPPLELIASIEVEFLDDVR